MMQFKTDSHAPCNEAHFGTGARPSTPPFPKNFLNFSKSERMIVELSVAENAVAPEDELCEEVSFVLVVSPLFLEKKSTYTQK